MRHIECLQGTKEWFHARIGLPTASEFSKLLTPKTLRLSSQSEAYLCKLVAEWLLQTPFEIETRYYAMDQGIEREQEAADYFELTTGLTTTLAGFCVTDDGKVGCSPDRFVSDGGLVEIKAPLASTHVSYLLAGELPIEHMLQVQGQIYVVQCPWVWFLSYFPALPPLLLQIRPDPIIQDALSTVLAEFCLRLDAAKAQLKELMP